MNAQLAALSLACLSALAWAAPAGAEKTVRKSSGNAEKAEDDETKEDLDEGTMTPHKAPPIEGLPVEEERTPLRETLQEQNDRPFDNAVYKGAELLGLPPEFVNDARTGLDLIYQRAYPKAMDHFGAMDGRWPGSAVGPVGRGLVFQALMLENFDFKYEKQYQTNWADARSKVTQAIEVPGNDAWDYFLLVGVVGVEAIHATRKYQYVEALTKAYEALRALEKCRELAPAFPDLSLADGINNYWRSVVAMNTALIPDGPDRRAEGISQMAYAETNSVFVGAPATLALTFSYLEERDLKRALGAATRSHQRYPHNVINNLVLARIYVYMRRFPAAEEVLADEPDNERAHYYLSMIYSRTKRMDQAIAEMEKYLTFQLIPEYRGTALYRLAGYHYRKGEYAKAAALYQQAVDADKHKGAKRRLEHMAKLRKEGKISY